MPVGRDWKQYTTHHTETLVCFQSAITIPNKSCYPASHLRRIEGTIRLSIISLPVPSISPYKKIICAAFCDDQVSTQGNFYVHHRGAVDCLHIAQVQTVCLNCQHFHLVNPDWIRAVGRTGAKHTLGRQLVIAVRWKFNGQRSANCSHVNTRS